MFAAMDTDDDGRVTPEEMEGFMHGAEAEWPLDCRRSTE